MAMGGPGRRRILGVICATCAVGVASIALAVSAPRSGHYAGATSEHRAVSLSVSASRNVVANFETQVGYNGACGRRSGQLYRIRVARMAIGKGGRFSAHTTARVFALTARAVVTGHFVGTRARGSVTIPGFVCRAPHKGVKEYYETFTARAAAQLPTSTNSHIVVIVMENRENTGVLGKAAAPYLNGLVHRYGLATQSFGVSHPSLPNYLALTSGSTHGITSDCTSCSVSAPNIVDQLTNAGISWKAYLEGVRAPCFTGATDGLYAKRHNPFMYYKDIAQNPARCSHLVGFGALTADLNAGQLPTFSWITPNLCNDTHNCSVAVGDSFLARTVPPLLRELGPHGFLVLTWDEGSSSASCCGGSARGGHVATVVAGPDVIPGARDSSPVDHYGVLGTIERALGLPLLGAAADARNGRLDPLFTSPPRLR
jgi:phosphatidylinositol-3-phosphatase